MDIRIYRSVELLALFFGLPFLYTMGVVPLPVLGFLWVGAFLAYAFLSTHRQFRFGDLWSVRIRFDQIRYVLLRFLVLALVMVGFVYLIDPQKLFSLPQDDPSLWLKLMLIYPLISVLPQSFIYRVFFIERYAKLFSSKTALLIFGTLSFAFMHLIFRNWVALVITAVGGFLFLETYLRSKSFLLSSIEHALYGCFAFSVGLGSFLYGGTYS